MHSNRSGKPIGVLKARRPYDMAVRVGRYLSPRRSPGDVDDWDIYWVAGVSSLRSIWHVLDIEDGKQSDLLRSIVNDFKNLEWGGNSPIFREFVEQERNKILKHWNWDVAPAEIRTPLLNGSERIETDLLWKEDEGALELFEKALIHWHHDLCIIEQATIESVKRPFSEPSVGNDLLKRSQFLGSLPMTPRL